MMHRAGEAIGREPLGQGTRIEKGAIDLFWLGAEYSMEANGAVGHGMISSWVMINRLGEWLGRRERTDRNVIPVRISDGKLHGSRARVHMGLLLEPRDESACPRQRHVEIIDTEKQEEAVAGRYMMGTHQGGMLMGSPLMKAEQNRSIRVDDLTEVVMGRSHLRQAK